ncbi:hypothetical protein D3C86_911590 [compost metagenome]
MIQHRYLAGTLLAASLLVSAGCAATTAGDLWPGASGSDRGPVSYFSGAHGTASLTIKVVDQRANRGVQSLGEADQYNGVLFKLTNTAKLKAPMVAAVGKQGGTYGMVFTKLPSDGAANYSLVAGLYRNVGTPTDPSDTAYATLGAKVGEGVSANFTLEPGQNKAITITINAVGELTFDSTTYVLHPTMPTFLSGDTSLTMTSLGLSGANTPLGAELKTYFVDTASHSVPGTEATASLPAHQDATVSLKVPTVTGLSAANYWVYTELSSGSTILSTRMRAVTVEPTASINVDPSGGNLPG